MSMSNYKDRIAYQNYLQDNQPTKEGLMCCASPTEAALRGMVSYYRNDSNEKKKDKMNNSEIIKQDLLCACKEALQCIARLAPFPGGDESDTWLRINGDYVDGVRAKLRDAITNAGLQIITLKEFVRINGIHKLEGKRFYHANSESAEGIHIAKAIKNEDSNEYNWLDYYWIGDYCFGSPPPIFITAEDIIAYYGELINKPVRKCKH